VFGQDMKTVPLPWSSGGFLFFSRRLSFIHPFHFTVVPGFNTGLLQNIIDLPRSRFTRLDAILTGSGLLGILYVLLERFALPHATKSIFRVLFPSIEVSSPTQKKIKIKKNVRRFSSSLALSTDVKKVRSTFQRHSQSLKMTNFSITTQLDNSVNVRIF
jgi:hypothetical protein